MLWETVNQATDTYKRTSSSSTTVPVKEEPMYPGTQSDRMPFWLIKAEPSLSGEKPFYFLNQVCKTWMRSSFSLFGVLINNQWMPKIRSIPLLYAKSHYSGSICTSLAASSGHVHGLEFGSPCWYETTYPHRRDAVLPSVHWASCWIYSSFILTGCEACMCTCSHAFTPPKQSIQAEIKTPAVLCKNSSFSRDFTEGWFFPVSKLSLHGLSFGVGPPSYLKGVLSLLCRIKLWAVIEL